MHPLNTAWQSLSMRFRPSWPSSLHWKLFNEKNNRFLIKMFQKNIFHISDDYSISFADVSEGRTRSRKNTVRLSSLGITGIFSIDCFTTHCQLPTSLSHFEWQVWYHAIHFHLKGLKGTEHFKWWSSLSWTPIIE